MIYTLKLIDDSNGKIEFPYGINNGLTAITFEFNQQDKLGTQRTSNIYNTITVRGTIDHEEAQEQTRLLLEWAQITDKPNKVYKHLTIEVWMGEDDLVRRYTVPEVYCVSYTENFGTADGDNNTGTFTLALAQKLGLLEKTSFASK